jgi:hypothetical protein
METGVENNLADEWVVVQFEVSSSYLGKDSSHPLGMPSKYGSCHLERSERSFLNEPLPTNDRRRIGNLLNTASCGGTDS